MNELQNNLTSKKLNDAILALEEVVSLPMDKHTTIIDATIQRFEFTIELFWKFLKLTLTENGIRVQFPKETLVQAYKTNLIEDEMVWIAMLHDRNITSHTYDRILAQEIYKRILTYTPILRATFERIKHD